MMERILPYKKIIIPCLLVALIFGYYVYVRIENKADVMADDGWLTDEEPVLDIVEEADEPVVTHVMVDMKGAVNKPGVYAATSGERVIDLVSRAGGLTDEAAEEHVNFAMYVEDEMVIYIPIRGEEVAGEIEALSGSIGNNGSGNGSNASGKININKASQAELETLAGVGPAKATAILTHREQNGPFKTAEDLMLVSGIGEKTFEKIAEQITVK